MGEFGVFCYMYRVWRRFGWFLLGLVVRLEVTRYVRVSGLSWVYRIRCACNVENISYHSEFFKYVLRFDIINCVVHVDEKRYHTWFHL